MMAEDPTSTWVYKAGLIDSDNFSLYVSSFYFVVATVVTVGYGDVTAASTTEKCICIVLMLIGVISFSFFTGALSSILQNYDQNQIRFRRKLSTLRDIKREHNLSHELFHKLVRSISYDFSNTGHRDVKSFMHELPYKLKVELAMEIHRSLYETIGFFKNREQSFITWVGATLRPIETAKYDFIYRKGDEVNESK